MHRQLVSPGEAPTWPKLLDHWGHVEADLHEVFGIDLWAPGALDRPWPWLKARVEALLTTQSRVARLFAPKPEKKPTATYD